MPSYVSITLAEMKEFCDKNGFVMHKRDPNTEWVANRICPVYGTLYLIRIYTSINDQCRGAGSDAIRVGAFAPDGTWMFGTPRVNRTQNWRSSILERVDELALRLHKLTD